jgi:hypothetical protein
MEVMAGEGGQARAEGGRGLAHDMRPRPSYCCALRHGLPGGCDYVDVPCHAVWEALRRQITVRVSGTTASRLATACSCLLCSPAASLGVSTPPVMSHGCKESMCVRARMVHAGVVYACEMHAGFTYSAVAPDACRG